MREYESCEGACAERLVALVPAEEFDALDAAAAASQARIAAMLPVAEELAHRTPNEGTWEQAYLNVAAAARDVLHQVGPAAPVAEEAHGVEAIEVWRCEHCGGVDAPQECIGVCLWRPVQWVPAEVYEHRRLEVAKSRSVERTLAGMLRRIAFSTPHAGQWERSWTALQSQAKHVVAPRGSTERIA